MIRLLALLLLLSTEGIPHRPPKVIVGSYHIDSSTIDRTYEPIGNPRSAVYLPIPPTTPEMTPFTILFRIHRQEVLSESYVFYLVAEGKLCTFNKQTVTWGWRDGDYHYVRISLWSSQRNGYWQTETVCDTCWWPNVYDCDSDTTYVLYRASDGRSSFALGNCRPESTWVEGRY